MKPPCNGPLGLTLFWTEPRSGDLAPPGGELRDDLLLDLTQAILAKEDLVTDVKGRRTERAARHRVAGVLNQLLFYVVLLRAGDDAINIEARGEKRVAEDLRVVHLLGLDPHVVVSGAEIGLEQAFELSSNHAAH